MWEILKIKLQILREIQTFYVTTTYLEHGNNYFQFPKGLKFLI